MVKSFFLQFALFVIIAHVNCEKLQMEQYLKECLDEFKIDEAAYKSKSISDKCFFKCFLDKTGAMTEDGRITAVEEMNSKYPDAPEEIKNAFATCGNTSGKDPCDTAKAFFVCFQSKVPNSLLA